MKLADTGAIAHMLGVTPNAVRIIAHRHPDVLPRRGRDTRGRTLYAIEDAEKILETRLAPV
jgi:hypothetical protein